MLQGSGQTVSISLETKIADCSVQQVTQFRYLGSMIQSYGETGGDVDHKILAKWMNASSVNSDRKIPKKVKGKFYCTTIRPAILYDKECTAQLYDLIT